MSKPVHPIRKMRLGIDRAVCNQNVERAIARHVKALLDALEDALFFCPPGKARDTITYLLTSWRAKV